MTALVTSISMHIYARTVIRNSTPLPVRVVKYQQQPRRYQQSASRNTACSSLTGLSAFLPLPKTTSRLEETWQMDRGLRPGMRIASSLGSSTNSCQQGLSATAEHLSRAMVKEQLLELGNEGGHTSSSRSDGSHQLVQLSNTHVSSPSTDGSQVPEPAAPSLATGQQANRSFHGSAANVPALPYRTPGLVAGACQPLTALTWQQELSTFQEASISQGRISHPSARPELACVDMPPLPPLPPPSPSEGPQVHDEYQHYLQRFEAGETLAQRWHRLKHSGKWEDLKEDWCEWQNDSLLQQLQASNAAKRGKRGKNRSRAELEDWTELNDLAPQKNRAHRAPATFQGHQMDLLASTRPAAGATLQEYSAAPHRPTKGARLDMGLSAEFQGMRPRGHSQPQVPAHPGHLRSNTQQLQLQRHGRHMYQQQPQHAREHAAATGQVVAPELMRQLYQLGAQLGQALQQGGGAAVSTPAALTASMEAVCKHMFKGDAAAMVEQLAVAFQQQQHRP